MSAAIPNVSRFAWLILIAGCVWQGACALARADDDPVRSGRTALGAGDDLPWYDSATDDLRRVAIPETPPPAASQPTSSSSATSETSVLQFLGWLAIAAVLAGLVFLLIRAFLTREQQGVLQTRTRARQALDTARVAELPVEIDAETHDLLALARRLYEAGDFDRAIIYLYSHQLIELDKRQIIRLAKGKTNRQYLRESGRQVGLAPLLERTMVAFEDVFFGKHSLDRGRFEVCWSGMPTFQSLLQQGAV